MSDSMIIDKLTSVNGIGNWAAKMYLIFVLDRQDILPLENAAFLKSYCWLYNTEKPTKKILFKNVQNGVLTLLLHPDIYTEH